MTIHRVADKAEWLKLRHHYMCSTEVSALFGMNPYQTAFELWHEKQKAEPTAFEASERMTWGLRMEEAIARAIAEEYGIKCRKLNAFASSESGLGASFDYEIIGVKEDVTVEDPTLQNMYRSLGPGILEIKNVDYWVFKQNWTSDGHSMEAPPHIEIQVQCQLHTIERSWAAIGVLVGGNSLKMLVRERDPAVGEQLDRMAAKFWRSIKANKPPQPVLPQDADMIAAMYTAVEPGKILDAQSDTPEAQRIQELVKAYHESGLMKAAHEQRQKAVKAELLPLIGDAEKVICPEGYSVSAGYIAEAEVPAYVRKGYRNIRINLKKESKA